jgi:hypothetical protein
MTNQPVPGAPLQPQAAASAVAAVSGWGPAPPGAEPERFWLRVPVWVPEHNGPHIPPPGSQLGWAQAQERCPYLPRQHQPVQQQWLPPAYPPLPPWHLLPPPPPPPAWPPLLDPWADGWWGAPEPASLPPVDYSQLLQSQVSVAFHDQCAPPGMDAVGHAHAWGPGATEREFVHWRNGVLTRHLTPEDSPQDSCQPARPPQDGPELHFRYWPTPLADGRPLYEVGKIHLYAGSLIGHAQEPPLACLVAGWVGRIRGVASVPVTPVCTCEVAIDTDSDL